MASSLFFRIERRVMLNVWSTVFSNVDKGPPFDASQTWATKLWPWRSPRQLQPSVSRFSAVYQWLWFGFIPKSSTAISQLSAASGALQKHWALLSTTEYPTIIILHTQANLFRKVSIVLVKSPSPSPKSKLFLIWFSYIPIDTVFVEDKKTKAVINKKWV